MLDKKRFIRILTSFILVLFSINYCFASENFDNIELNKVKILTLPECINISLEQSPLLLQAKEEIEVSRARLAEARSGYFPRIHVKASYNYFNTNNVIKTRFPDDLVSTIAENSVMESLRDVALISGVNPISGSAITEMDVIAAAAARAGTTPDIAFNQLVQHAKNKIHDDGKDILWTPLMGTHLFRTEISYQQPLFLWGQVYNKNKQAKAGIGASRSSFKKVKNDLVFQIKDYYNKVLLSKDGVELARDTEIKFETLKDIIEGLYNAGAENVTKLDLLEVEATLGLIRSKLAETEKSLELTKAALKQIIGIDEDINIDVAEETQSVEYIDAALKDSIHKAFLNRPEFSELEYGIRAKKYDIKATRAENRPKLFIDSAFEYNLDDKSYLEPDPVDFRFSVIADIPLFDGLQTRSRVNQKKHELAKMKQQRRQLQQGIALEVTDAYLTLQEAEKKLKATETAVDKAIENRSLARQSFELEIIDSEKVIKAQLLEAKVKTQFILSMYEYNVAKARLDRVMGETDELGINFIVKPLLPYDNIESNIDQYILQEKPEQIL